MRVWISVALGAITVAYPAVVYLSMDRLPPQWLGAALVVLAVIRALLSQQKFWWVTAAGAALLCGASWWRADELAIKLYPVLVNAVMLAVFAFSLCRPPSVVERLARLQEPDLPPSGVRYTRQVTVVWCWFFVCNGAIAAYTAVAASAAVWALYNGAVAYVFMGCLMGVEWCVRQRVRRKNTKAAQP